MGWVLIANGWSDGFVGDGSYKLYSDDKYNPESSPSLRRHSVLLHDSERELLLLAFEDLKRDSYGCDNDFNDAIFYVTANPPEAVKTDSLEETKEAADSDLDGVADDYDHYPDDPERAFNNYYPSEDSYATLAFEDQWPRKGDYDFNDLVLDYNILEIQNGNNEIVELELTYIIRAAGAGYRNGFGFQLELPREKLLSVEGSDISRDYLTLTGRGDEYGQSLATIICSDDVFHSLNVSDTIINTMEEKSYIEPSKLKIKVTFTTEVKREELGTPPYNHFLIVNRDRGREVHLMNYAPTEMFNSGYFKTFSDNSSPQRGEYFLSGNLNPWALNFPEQFAYPKERVGIKAVYKKFHQWATSGGERYPDWYRDIDNYRNNSLLYNPE